MYTSLLTHIQNAQKVRKERIKTPFSAMDEKVLAVLADNHFIESFERKGRNPKKYLEVVLLYKSGSPVISGIKFMSTPSRHVYKKYVQLRQVKQGYGISVVSTPSGIMSGADAKKKKVGGEVLFNIW